MKKNFLLLYLIVVSCLGVNTVSARTYEIGDYYYENNIEGVVYFVTEDAKHGRIVSINQTKASWDEGKDKAFLYGNGWRMPNKREFSKIERNLKLINSTLSSNGGEIIVGSYWTSESFSTDEAWYYWLRESRTNEVIPRPKDRLFNIRLIHAF